MGGITMTLFQRPRDPNFNQTTLLLSGNFPTNGAQNNTFLDSSSNGFTITRNPSTGPNAPTQGTFSPFSQTGWGNFFNGSTDLLTLPSTSSLSFGTGDFCVEFWIYRTVSQGNGIFSNAVNVGGGDAQFEIQINTSSKVLLLGWSTTFMTSVSSIALNTWYHVAVVRSGTSMAMFINGIRDTTATSANNFSSTNAFTIGKQAGGTLYMAGYLSNLRAVKGSFIYDPASTSITVPAAPLTNITNTSLLTCQSNRFIDNGTANSGSGFALTISGTPSVQPFSPFVPSGAYTTTAVGGSGYFDGTGDYLTVADNAVLEPVGNNFCIEMSYYPTSVAGTRNLVGKRVNPTTDYGFVVLASGTSVLVYISSANSSYDIVNGVNIGTLVNNQWHHIAIYRITNAWYASFNGTITTLNASNASSVNNNAGAWGIGADSNGAAPIQGYMANTRFVIGSSVYTSTSAPFPTAPLTAITNTQLLLNFTNAGIVDSTAKNVLETVGNAQISTTQSKFGGTSMYFDGNGDNLLTTPNQVFDLGASDFTIEFWLYPVSTSAGTLVYSTSNRVKTDALAILLSGGNVLGYATPSGGSVWGIMSAGNFGSVTINTWSHVALVRNGSSFRGYVNGVQSASLATTSSAITSFNGFSIGSNGAAADFLNGYIDDLRITRFARYTANFNVPTIGFTDR